MPVAPNAPRSKAENPPVLRTLQAFRRENEFISKIGGYMVELGMMRRIQRNTPFAFGIAVVLFSAAACFVSISTASADELERSAQESKDKYAADLKQLAAWCEEKGLKEEARKTRAALGPDDPMKFYVPVLPVEVGPPKLPEGASPAAVEWDQKLNRLRKDQSVALYDLARRAVRSNRPGLALELALDAIRANPDNETVRRLFGYQKYQNQWRTVYEAKKLRQGLVWHDKFGWLPKSHVKRYEDGQRLPQQQVDHGRRRRRRAPRHRIGLGHRDRALRDPHRPQPRSRRRAGRKTRTALSALGTALHPLLRLRKRRDRALRRPGESAELADRAASGGLFPRPRRIRQIARKRRCPTSTFRSASITAPTLRTAYFFADKESDDRTLYHEATHQLFHESRPVSPKVGRLANFWIIEGIAMYMESLKVRDGYYELGGFDDERMLAARYRLAAATISTCRWPIWSATAWRSCKKTRKSPRSTANRRA